MTDSSGASVVLGGGGFLGINLCRRLAASGHKVRAFGHRCLFPDAIRGVEWHQGELSDSAALSRVIKPGDIVFHLIHNTTPQSAMLNMAGDIEHNVVPSIALLELCRKVKTARIVFVSSGGTVYGRAAQIPTPETAPTEPITAYGITKLAIEKYLSLYGELYGLDYRVLRLTNPFGPFQTGLKRQGLIAAAISKTLRDQPIEIWGDGSAVRDFIFVDDAVDAFLAAASDNGTERVLNIGSGQGRSVRDVLGAIEKVLNRKLKIQWNAQRAIDVEKSVVAIDRAKVALGWAPHTSFERGLESTVGWWRDNEAMLRALTH